MVALLPENRQTLLFSATMSAAIRKLVASVANEPQEIAIEPLQTELDNLAIFRSKAVGEPPFMYGIGTYFALRNAIKAFNPTSPIAFDAPMTPEKVLLGLYSQAATGTRYLHEQSVRHVAAS